MFHVLLVLPILLGPVLLAVGVLCLLLRRKKVLGAFMTSAGAVLCLSLLV